MTVQELIDELTHWIEHSKHDASGELPVHVNGNPVTFTSLYVKRNGVELEVSP